jgi:methylisocitrate lyase
MTYLLGATLPSEPAGDRFRKLLAQPAILGIPGTHNGLAAQQAKAAGFSACYLSGAAMTASMGLPDLGIITVEDVCFFIRQVTRASGLPVLVDGDTGYGEALNVMNMVRNFEDAGAAAVHLEDQILPKKCGHLNDKKLAAPQDMAAKVAAGGPTRRMRAGICTSSRGRMRRRPRAWMARWRGRNCTWKRARMRFFRRR